MDNTYESETRSRQEMELMKKDFSKLQDKLDQTEAELRRVTREKEQLSSEMTTAVKLKDNDVDKLELEITQLNTERDQLVRQLEKSQDMLLSFQQGKYIIGVTYILKSAFHISYLFTYILSIN